MGKETLIRVQEAQLVLYGVNPRRKTQETYIHHTGSIKDKILKATKEKQHITYRGTVCYLIFFFQQKLHARKERQDIFEVIKGKNLQPRIFHPARLSFRFDGEIKSFIDKQMLRKFSTIKPTLQKIVKELLQVEKKKRPQLETKLKFEKVHL